MKSTRRIGLLLVLVFLIPALFFSVYEISSLNKDEKMIQEVYNKQLEAILFSVNQYGDDLLSSWITKVETASEKAARQKMPVRISDLVGYNSCLNSAFIYDTVNGKPSQRFFAHDSSKLKLFASLEASLQRQKDTISRLVAYKVSGFQKAEIIRFEGDTAAHLQCFVFITGDLPGQYRVAGLLINPESFVQDFIGPRLQTIAKDQFVISVINDITGKVVYATLQDSARETKAEAVTRSFWVFPNYKLGINTKGNSMQALVRERTTTNLALLLSLDVILIIAVVLVFRNVRKEVRLAQNKSDFVSNVSHEIRTPLALISMFAETLDLDRVKSEEKKREYYHIISKESQRLAGIVNKILNFSQSEANKKAFHIEPLQASTEIQTILSTYDFHLKNKGFEYTFTNHTDLEILADKEAFAEVVINLLDNAVKYSTEQKKIEITMVKENSNGAINIKDYGIGISKEDQKHIFDKFYRVSTGNLAKSRGTGLGLSLVKQLMQAQQGEVTVTSELGKGALFTLHFQLSKQ